MFGALLQRIGALPSSIGLMKELQVLDASYNSICNLPVEFGALSNLRYMACGVR